MPRSLTSATTTAVTATITRPVYLLEIRFTPIVRYSSLGTVSWNNDTWISSGLRVDRVKIENGLASGSVTLSNQDQSLSALILSEGGHDVVAKLWIADAEALAMDDPILLIDGVTDGARINADSCSIDLVATTINLSFAPRQICAPPLFNHLPPRGTSITWGGATYIIEGR